MARKQTHLPVGMRQVFAPAKQIRQRVHKSKRRIAVPATRLNNPPRLCASASERSGTIGAAISPSRPRAKSAHRFPVDSKSCASSCRGSEETAQSNPRQSADTRSRNLLDFDLSLPASRPRHLHRPADRRKTRISTPRCPSRRISECECATPPVVPRMRSRLPVRFHREDQCRRPIAATPLHRARNSASP